ncbi:MAG: glycosyl hydrolase [Christensenellales bacterium]|jgi:hypothetical protein
MDAPLFRDPIHDGAADPTVIYAPEQGLWYLFYTCRRAQADTQDVAWCHGTDIGVAVSRDGGASFRYRGALALGRDPGRDTYWAPEIIRAAGVYHMFVSCIEGVPVSWEGARHICHYTSADLWHWQFVSRLYLSSDRVIDACVFPLPQGGWRMWYKDEARGSHTWFADSADLDHWRVGGEAIADAPHEGPNVFAFKGRYFMLVDLWHGQGVYVSDDLRAWRRQGILLDRPGPRADDGNFGLHADAVVLGSRAFIFYFTHPGRDANQRPLPGENPRRTSLQAAELTLDGAGRLCCERDRPYRGMQDAP